MNKINIKIEQTFDLDDFAALIEESIYQNDIPMLIALIDSKAASWDVTKKLIKHFKQHEILYIEESKEIEETPEVLTPELLI